MNDAARAILAIILMLTLPILDLSTVPDEPVFPTEYFTEWLLKQIQKGKNNERKVR